MAQKEKKPHKKLDALKHLHILDLKAGMYVADPGIDRRKRPYLYTGQGLLASDDEVRRIVEDGYLEVFIDPDRSPAYIGSDLPEAVWSDAGRPEEKFAGPESPFAAKTGPEEDDRACAPGEKPPGPKVPFAAAVGAAAEAHDAAVGYARDFMRDIRFGKLDMSPASNFVDRILRSLDDNADAMHSLCRLRRTGDYTYMHCVNVGVLSSMFARHLNMETRAVRAVGLAGIFHDLGKALVPPQILNAPRKLTDAERTVMKTHPALGYRQIKDVPGVIPEVTDGMLHHHERYDGAGYPAGLSGNEISDVGYMVALADIYDALTSRRVYKEALPPHRALGIMYGMRDRALRPGMVESFIRMLGVYPVSSVVELSDGSLGVVCAGNPDAPLKPAVIPVRDAEGNPLPNNVLELAGRDSALSIVCSVPEAAVGIDPAAILGLPGIPSVSVQ
jgi:HD-GYP domain-containing protein (c-di-GMP phosphodiesterase class II)